MEQKSNKTYLDFADSDYPYVMQDIKEGRLYNQTCVAAPNCVERYLKHLIEEFSKVNPDISLPEKTEILRKYSIPSLLTFLKERMQVDISYNDFKTMNQANGYYFSVRYPGEDSRFVTDFDLAVCGEALEVARAFTYATIPILQERLQQQQVNTVLLDDVLAEAFNESGNGKESNITLGTSSLFTESKESKSH